MSVLHCMILFLFQLQRPRGRLCLFVLPVIPLSSSYSEMAGLSCFPVVSWRSLTVRPWALLPPYWNPNTCLGFQVKHLYLSGHLLCWTSRTFPMSRVSVASLCGYSCCFWDFYCNLLHIWRTGPYESMRLSTEHNSSKIKGPLPFAEQREV